MNILKKLTLESIKRNKKRSIGTIMGIIMSVALICAVAGMFASFQKTLIVKTISDDGYYHLRLSNIDNVKLEEIKLNKDIKDIMVMGELGYSLIENSIDSESSYIEVMSSSREEFDGLKYKIKDGRFPENNSEIVVSEKVIKNSKYKIGDEIELNIGTRKTLDGYDLDRSNPVHEDIEYIESPVVRKFKIVGVVKKQGFGSVIYGITTGEVGKKFDAYLALKNPHDYKVALANLLGAKSYSDVLKRNFKTDFEYNINSELLRWETLSFSESTMTMLIAVFTIVVGIIVITSVFCIRNSFAISVVEKMRMYGMLASVGATRKQIKKSVVYEGMLLAIVGIPIGILCGILADYVLVKVINMLIGESMFTGIDGMVFVVSWPAILIAIILGFLTIYLSSISSAIKASRVSPIENLKNSNEIKINSKKLKTPKWISGIFKTGGVLAYKNLKRSKKKYRTTVVSLTVSIFVFITMSSFINEAFNQSDLYYVDYEYNVVINGGLKGNEKENIRLLRTLEDVEEMFVIYKYDRYSINVYDMSHVNVYDDDPRVFVEDESGRLYASPSLIGLDDESFKSYTKKIGLSYEDCKNKAILYDTFYYSSISDGNSKYKRRYNYKKGDMISGEDSSHKINIEVGGVTDQAPYGHENSYYEDGIIIVNKDYFDQMSLEIESVLIQSSEADSVVLQIDKLNSDLRVFNHDEDAKAQRGYVLVVSIFLYGFITVISLIGVTNIFNTITSNMELRSREFAILKSIGMTKKEFNRMVNLETLFYSTKALVYGITLGILGSVLIHKGFGIKNELIFNLPYTAIIISILFVFIIVGIIMKYSIKKINKQNTIETIRNENI